MASMLRLAAKFAATGALVPVAFFLISLAVPLFPIWLLRTALVLCPPYVLFFATAACEPFDACSLNTLALVVLFNAISYGLLGCVVYKIAAVLRRRSNGPATDGAA